MALMMSQLELGEFLITQYHMNKLWARDILREQDGGRNGTQRILNSNLWENSSTGKVVIKLLGGG